MDKKQVEKTKVELVVQIINEWRFMLVQTELDIELDSADLIYKPGDPAQKNAALVIAKHKNKKAQIEKVLAKLQYLKEKYIKEEKVIQN